MKYYKIGLAAALAGITLAACSPKKSDKTSDTLVTADKTEAASKKLDSPKVAEADSTHSFRNDRGTDSVAAGKSIPVKP